MGCDDAVGRAARHGSRTQGAASDRCAQITHGGASFLSRHHRRRDGRTITYIEGHCGSRTQVCTWLVVRSAAGAFSAARCVVTEDSPTPLPEDAPHWAELQRLFHLIEALPAGEREATLLGECADADLCASVLALVQAAEVVPPFASESKPPPSTLVGGYRLIRQIGAGGVGTVYLAERLVDGTTLFAALKIMAPYAVDASFLERFHREQQHLAALNHPNITRLLDAGWTGTGQPYLVTEYVDGVHLDAYCDEHRLGIEERLRYFLQIC